MRSVRGAQNDGHDDSGAVEGWRGQSHSRATPNRPQHASPSSDSAECKREECGVDIVALGTSSEDCREKVAAQRAC